MALLKACDEKDGRLKSIIKSNSTSDLEQTFSISWNLKLCNFEPNFLMAVPIFPEKPLTKICTL